MPGFESVRFSKTSLSSENNCPILAEEEEGRAFWRRKQDDVWSNTGLVANQSIVIHGEQISGKSEHILSN